MFVLTLMRKTYNWATGDRQQKRLKRISAKRELQEKTKRKKGGKEK
jgi:hypothetical protein